MNRNMWAFAISTAVITVLSSVVMTLMYFDLQSDIGLIMWGSLVIAGFVTASLATTRKILLAVLLVFPSALVFTAANGLWQLAGEPADHMGIDGGIVVLLMSVPFGAVLCGIGGILGWFITRNTVGQQ